MNAAIVTIEASRETSDRYTVKSTHRTEAAAIRRARKDGTVIIHQPACRLYDECWYTAAALTDR
jgi:hypothetical protein